MTYQSPIAPGISFYEATLGERPAYPALPGATTADVVIVGGGFTGLQAAYHLAASGKDVVLIEGARFGDGALGPQWRPAWHRTKGLGGGKRGRFRPRQREGPVCRGRAGEDASAQLFGHARHRRRFPSRSDLGGAQAGLRQGLPRSREDHDRPVRLRGPAVSRPRATCRGTWLDAVSRRHP